MSIRRFYRTDNGSRSFWYLTSHGKTQAIWEGSLGTTGEKRKKTFDSAKLAKSDSDHLVEEQIEAGFVEYPPRELRSKSLGSRRGYWTTWADPTTWSVCLLHIEREDLRSELLKCDCVASVLEVTSEVLESRFVPPKQRWSLLIETSYQKWAMFVDRGGYNESLDELPRQFSGEFLRTGGVSENGICYVWHWIDGKSVLDFRTDGMGWPTLPEDLEELDDDEEDEDWGDVYVFETDLYPKIWPYGFSRAEMAHQQLILDRDAYVPLLTYHDKLEAAFGHQNASSSKSINRVSCVTFREF